VSFQEERDEYQRWKSTKHTLFRWDPFKNFDKKKKWKRSKIFFFKKRWIWKSFSKRWEEM